MRGLTQASSPKGYTTMGEVPNVPEPDRFFALVTAFLAAHKTSVARMSWRGGATHPDNARAQIRVVCPSMPRNRARVVMASHTYLYPRKYTFALLLGRTRIASLDINPRRNHKNALQRLPVSSTHWSFYPCDTVAPDERSFVHSIWLDEFCKKCNIEFRAPYEKPPHSYEQRRLGI